MQWNIKNATLTFTASLSLCLTLPTSADEIGKPVTISTGTIHAIFTTPDSHPDALDIFSVGLVDEADSSLVLCLDVGNGQKVESDTPALSFLGAAIILRGYAYTGTGCTGAQSGSSVDSYRVQYQIPGPPVLTKVPRNLVELRDSADSVV